MKKNLILVSFFAMSVVMPAMADYKEHITDGGLGLDDWMQENSKYDEAATQTNLGVDKGAVIANAWYNVAQGYYLPNNSAEVSPCLAGYQCSGKNGVAVGPNSEEETMSLCQADTYNTGGYPGENEEEGICIKCTGNYHATGDLPEDHDSRSDCKMTVELNKVGGTGMPTLQSGTAGVLDQPTDDSSLVYLICTEGKACYLPDARSMTPQAGWTYTGGWAQQPPCSSTYTENVVPQINKYVACMKPKIYPLALQYVPNDNQDLLAAVDDWQDRVLDETSGFCYKDAPAISGFSGAGKALYWSGVNGSCDGDNLSQILAANNPRITVPTSVINVDDGTGEVVEGAKTYFFQGFNTKSDRDGVWAIDKDGYINKDWLNDLKFGEIEAFSGTKSLYAFWTTTVSCGEGLYFKGSSMLCEPCEKGYECKGFNDVQFEGNDLGLTACTGDKYSDETGLSECKTCSDGFYGDGSAQDSEAYCMKKDIFLDRNGGQGYLVRSDGYHFGDENTSASVQTKITCMKGDDCELPAPSGLKKIGYTFSGTWGKDLSCSGDQVRDFISAQVVRLMSADKRTLFACKTRNEFNITWIGVDINGKSSTSSSAVYYGDDIITPEKAYEKDGQQRFLGWKFVRPAQ